MANKYKTIFLDLLQKKRNEGYSFITEHVTKINNKNFKYLEFNIDPDILHCAVQLAKEKSNYTMALNQAAIPRDTITKVKKSSQGILAEMFIHILLTERYNFNVVRFDLERMSFVYSKDEYDLKILIDDYEFEIESRSSNIHHKLVEDFIKDDVIIGPYGNYVKKADELADFHFRPIYTPSFEPFICKTAGVNYNKKGIALAIRVTIPYYITRY